MNSNSNLLSFIKNFIFNWWNCKSILFNLKFLLVDFSWISFEQEEWESRKNVENVVRRLDIQVWRKLLVIFKWRSVDNLRSKITSHDVINEKKGRKKRVICDCPNTIDKSLPSLFSILLPFYDVRTRTLFVLTHSRSIS